MTKLYLFLLCCIPSLVGAQISFSNGSYLLGNFENYSGAPVGVIDVNGDGTDDIVRLDHTDYLSLVVQSKGDNAYFQKHYGFIAGNSWAVCIADTDNDGRCEIFTGGAYNGLKFLTLDSDLNSTTEILTAPGTFVQGTNFADINNDGFLDLFICHDDGPSRILGNNQDGTFSFTDEDWIPVSIYPTTEQNAGNYGSVWTDFDADGDLDLYIAKCRQGVSDTLDPRRINQLWVNDGNNNYSEAGADHNLDVHWQSWTADFADIDNDGDLDCFLTNHDYESQLLLNDGSNNYEDITTAADIDVNGLPVQAIFKDFDNDGYVDLLVSGSNTDLYMNDGDQTFTWTDANIAGDIHTFGIGDLDQNGFLDIYAGYGSGFNNPGGDPDQLWLNDGNDNNFLVVQLQGIISNHTASGAWLELYGTWGKQIREVRTGESYGIVNSTKQHFGLGDATAIDSLVILWPSGLKEVHFPSTINTQIHIVEGECIGQPQDLTISNGTGLLCPGDNLTLTAPPGTSFDWSTGENSSSITVSEQGVYNVTVTDANGCALPSPSIQVIVNPQEFPFIESDNIGLSCEGSEVTLTASDANGYLWSTGDTTQSIAVTQGGTYNVTVTGLCTDWPADAITLEFFDQPASPTTVGDTIDMPGQTGTLVALSDDPVRWLDDCPDGFEFMVGDTFNTPQLTATTTFFAQAISSPGVQPTGEPTHAGNSNYSGNNFNGGLNFNVQTPLTLRTVTVYTDTPGERLFVLIDGQNQTVNNTVVNLVDDTTKVVLDWYIEPGEDYLITTDENINIINLGYPSPRLQRNQDTTNYPYTLPGILDIYGSTVNNGFYYYFYNWEVEADITCYSACVPVTAVVLDPNNTNELVTDGAHFEVFPNPTQEFVTIVPIAQDLTGPANILVFNGLGALQYSQAVNFAAGQTKLNLTGFASGVYTLHIQMEGQTFVHRITKMK